MMIDPDDRFLYSQSGETRHFKIFYVLTLQVAYGEVTGSSFQQRFLKAS